MVQIDGDSLGKTLYTSSMTTSKAQTFPQTSDAPPSLEERLAVSLAENERLVKLVDELRRKIVALEQENLALRERLNRNSTNSNQPPSQDNPFQPPQKPSDSSCQPAKAGAQSGGKKSRPYHKSAQQQRLPPDKIVVCRPKPCACGCQEYVDVSERVHQWMELVQRVEIVHYRLQQGRCARCGRLLKERMPKGRETGYGPGLTAFVATLNAAMGVSWRKLADCLHQVFGAPISAGAIGKCLRRAATAIEPHCEAIGRAVRASPVNHVDETTWRQHGPLGKKLLWLWVLVNREAALFRLAPSRKAEEFEALRGDWAGTLVSDDYAVYRKWEHGRQTCLAHLMRQARGFSESGDKETAACGQWILQELSLLVRMSARTPQREWQAFRRRFSKWVERYRALSGKAGAFVRRLAGEFDALTTFLRVDGVEPTNNRAERTVRHGVILRKISIGTASEKGQRWIERALALAQTCRVQHKSFFEVMRDALHAHFQKLAPDLGWIENIAAKYGTLTDTP